MNKFTKFVTKESILYLSEDSKLKALDRMIDRAAEISKIDRDEIFRLLWKREQMMTTAVGDGFALPHIRVTDDIQHPYVVIGVSGVDIDDYRGQDDRPVRVIALLIAKDDQPEEYLQLLSSISRRFRDGKLIGALTSVGADAARMLELVKAE
ncbi:MAG: PTS sugar transporter subunit IIA [Victivallaceae bacterium]|nr:PTS sugar transporter subunit IIA [Victivallaceae bacterium]